MYASLQQQLVVKFGELKFTHARRDSCCGTLRTSGQGQRWQVRVTGKPHLQPQLVQLGFFGAFCLDVKTLFFGQLLGFPLNYQKLNL